MNSRSILAASGSLVLGGALLRRTLKARAKRNGATVAYDEGARIEKFATIAREPGDVFAAWRNYASLPLVMPNLVRVEEDGERTRWTARGPLGVEVSWSAVTTSDQAPHRISWRSDDSPVPHAGTVRFEPAPGGRGTEVTLEIEYAPPAGPLGKALVKAATLPPRRLVEVDLRRFKSVLETGSVALNGTDVSA